MSFSIDLDKLRAQVRASRAFLSAPRSSNDSTQATSKSRHNLESDGMRVTNAALIKPSHASTSMMARSADSDAKSKALAPVDTNSASVSRGQDRHMSKEPATKKTFCQTYDEFLKAQNAVSLPSTQAHAQEIQAARQPGAERDAKKIAGNKGFEPTMTGMEDARKAIRGLVTQRGNTEHNLAPVSLFQASEDQENTLEQTDYARIDRNFQKGVASCRPRENESQSRRCVQINGHAAHGTQKGVNMKSVGSVTLDEIRR
jgi:hypothetical protein